jgi:hypothetical protein
VVEMLALLSCLVLILGVLGIIMHNIKRFKGTGRSAIDIHTEEEINEKGTEADGVVKEYSIKGKDLNTKEYQVYYVFYVILDNDKVKHTISSKMTIEDVRRYIGKRVHVKFLDKECVIQYKLNK